MSETFERHRDKRISEMRERKRNYRLNKKVEMKTFGQRVEKAWKNINEIKPNWKDLSYITPLFLVLDLMEGKTNEKNEK